MKIEKRRDPVTEPLSMLKGQEEEAELKENVKKHTVNWTEWTELS